MTKLEEYYNKFNEDKRLLSRHGRVEFNTTMNFIKRYLGEISDRITGAQAEVNDARADKNGVEIGVCCDRVECDVKSEIKILDVGAGTGRYSVALANEGYDVTAIEPVKYNLGILKQKGSTVKAFQGNALKLKRCADGEFDLTIMLGPMYHLHSTEDQARALSEAKRVTKKGGFILVGYVMADYAVIRHGFMDHEIMESKAKGELTEDYQIIKNEESLYDYARLFDINMLDEAVGGLERITIFSPEGPADYIRHILNAMSEEEFEVFLDYQLQNCERPELVGAGSHTVDVLRKL